MSPASTRPFQTVRIGEPAGRKSRRQPSQQAQQGREPSVVIVMVMVVMAVAAGIGAGFGVERRLDLVDVAAEALDHLVR